MTSSIIEMADQSLATTYSRFPVAFVRGQGCTLWDDTGKSYLDFLSGIAVCNLGHAHPAVANAVAKQAKILCHVSNLYYTEPQAQLAQSLVNHCFADRVFFCNSGAEANEAAIKLARKTFSDAGHAERFRIVAMEQSFHGRTMATLSATGQAKIRKGFDPILSGFDFVPFDDMTALTRAVGDGTCAVLIEPIQGEGGIRVPSQGYLTAVRQLCDDQGVLLIFDEVQTGMGRTGSLFAHTQFNVTPDIMTLAKALANGFPMGAMLATETVAAAFGPGSHATTFGGTPVVAAAAQATLEALTHGGVIEAGRARGDYLHAQLNQLAQRHAIVESVRGLGLLQGVVLTEAAAPVVSAALENGFVINAVQDRILRIAPPLIVTEDEIDQLVACLDAVLNR